MDQEKDPGLNRPAPHGGVTRRGVLKAGVGCLVTLGLGGGAVYYLVKRSGSVTTRFKSRIATASEGSPADNAIRNSRSCSAGRVTDRISACAGRRRCG